MPNKGLLFIPDISGFTRFVNGTEIEHSKMIIQELLEILLNSNTLGLEVSEIEGDAILFYKFGDAPDLVEIYGQVEKMFIDFHKNLLNYSHRKYCHCKACISAIDLTLKIITHYGEFTGYNVKNFYKLIGKDVIIAHQLLKNDINLHEYWLVTKDLLGDGSSITIAEWMKWNSGKKLTETGEVEFNYTQLSDLKSKVPPPHFPMPDLSGSVKMMTFSREYETDIITLFHATGDFSFRNKWMEGVEKVEEMSHYLPRVGMKCICHMHTGKAVIYSSSYSYSPDRVEFSETDDKKTTTLYFSLQKIERKKTRLSIDLYYHRKNRISKAVFNILKKDKLEAHYNRSLDNLENLVKEINFEYSEH